MQNFRVGRKTPNKQTNKHRKSINRDQTSVGKTGEFMGALLKNVRFGKLLRGKLFKNPLKRVLYKRVLLKTCTKIHVNL